MAQIQQIMNKINKYINSKTGFFTVSEIFSKVVPKNSEVIGKNEFILALVNQNNILSTEEAESLFNFLKPNANQQISMGNIQKEIYMAQSQEVSEEISPVKSSMDESFHKVENDPTNVFKKNKDPSEDKKQQIIQSIKNYLDINKVSFQSLLPIQFYEVTGKAYVIQQDLFEFIKKISQVSDIEIALKEYLFNNNFIDFELLLKKEFPNEKLDLPKIPTLEEYYNIILLESYRNGRDIYNEFSSPFENIEYEMFKVNNQKFT